jgi:hypothetical protein
MFNNLIIIYKYQIENSLLKLINKKKINYILKYKFKKS